MSVAAFSSCGLPLLNVTPEGFAPERAGLRISPILRKSAAPTGKAVQVRIHFAEPDANIHIAGLQRGAVGDGGESTNENTFHFGNDEPFQELVKMLHGFGSRLLLTYCRNSPHHHSPASVPKGLASDSLQ